MKMAVLAAVFAVATMASPVSAGLSAFKVFPNPFRPAQGHTTVTFDGITGGAEIRIYNVAGRLVFEKTIDPSLPSFVWNVKNEAGNDIASGMYIYFIESTGEQKTGKLGILR